MYRTRFILILLGVVASPAAAPHGREIATAVAAQQASGPQVRIVLPLKDAPLSNPLKIQALVRARGEAQIVRVDAYLNEQHLGTRTEPPYEWEPRFAGATALIRIVAIDTEGVTSSEELVVGAPGVATFEAEVETVRFNLSVTDRGGTPIPNLRVDEIRVEDNGTRQVVDEFTRTEAPLRIVLVLDRSRSLAPKMDETRRAVAAFLSQLRPEDQVMLIGVNHRIVTLSGFTRDHDVIEGIVDTLVAEGSTAIFDGLLEGLQQFNETAERKERRALLVFTDGADISSRNPEQRVIEEARDAGITIYAVGQGDALDDGGLKDVLKELAQSSGGEAIFEGDERKLSQAFSEVARAMRGLYFVAYKPSDVRPGWHEIKVDVDRRGTRARHRPGYRRGAAEGR